MKELIQFLESLQVEEEEASSLKEAIDYLKTLEEEDSTSQDYTITSLFRKDNSKEH